MPISATSQQEFSDADFRIVDNADQTKKLAFEVSGIATATTRTWTVPDANVTVTAAAATVLDDTTVAAMLATLGGVAKAGDTMTGGLVAPALRSGVSGGIADDAVADMGDVAPTTSVIIIWSTSLSGALRVTVVHARTQSPAVSFKFGDSTNVSFVTTNVTGTTGTDGNITLSFTTGHMKIENRSGGSVGYGYAVLGTF